MILRSACKYLKYAIASITILTHKNYAREKRSRLRTWKRKRGRESVRERLSVRKRKAEVIDRCRDTLLRIMLVKGVESWTGKGSKTRKLQFIHQSFDWTRLRRPAKGGGRDTGRRINVYSPCRCVQLRATTCAKCLANPGWRIPCPLYSRKLTNPDKLIRD